MWITISIHYTISCLRHEWEKTKHPWRLAWNIILEVWFRSCSFLFMGDGCSFRPFIFQASREWGSPTGITQHVEVFKGTFNLYSLRNDGVVFEGKRHKFPWRRGATLVFRSQRLTKKCIHWANCNLIQRLQSDRRKTWLASIPHVQKQIFCVYMNIYIYILNISSIIMNHVDHFAVWVSFCPFKNFQKIGFLETWFAKKHIVSVVSFKFPKPPSDQPLDQHGLYQLY